MEKKTGGRRHSMESGKFDRRKEQHWESKQMEESKVRKLESGRFDRRKE